MRPGSQRGQALLLIVGAMCAVLVGALVIGAIARGVGVVGREQRAADLAALSGAGSMHADYDRLFEPPQIAGAPNPRHLERATYLARARAQALRTAQLNGARAVSVVFPDASQMAPLRVRVTVSDPVRVGRGSAAPRAAARAIAEAQLAPPAGAATMPLGPGDYHGRLAYRQGKPMRPDVALAFDRMEAAARGAGLGLIVNSAFRSDAEQAKLFAAHPDPKWVAPPGKSLHRLGTELDLGPAGAYGWLAANARRFHFVKRYSWEPWHFGYLLNAGTGSVGFKRPGGGDGTSAVPSFVPPRFAAPISRAAQRWNVSAALLAAQLYAESGFNPFSVSGAGAQGIAQFTPGTARAYGLRNPFDAGASIDAQGHLMRDLLRQFSSVPLALAAYNAGPAPVSRCGCIPPYPETQAYVARIIGLLHGAGGAGMVADTGLAVRLLR